MKRDGVGFRIAQGGTLAIAVAALVFVVVQAQGGCQDETTAEPEPMDESRRANAVTTDEPTSVAAEPNTTPAAEPATDATAKPAPKPAKPGARKPAPRERDFLPSSKAGGVPNFIDQPTPQQAQQAPTGK